MNILVSGATSMIGLKLTERLLANGENVVALVRENSQKASELAKNDRLKIVHCNMNDYDKLNKLINVNVDACFGLAWSGTRGKERNEAYIQEENYKNSLNLLREVTKLGCKKFITSGSQAEYGPSFNNEVIYESAIPNPNTEYGKYKLAFYEQAKDYCKVNDCVLIEPRFFSLYGPNDYPGTLIMSVLKKMLKNENCDLTECTQLWDFLYIDDAVEGLLKMLDKVDEGIYNFSYGDPKPLKEFIEEMYTITESKSILNYGAIPYPKTGAVNINPNVDKLKGLGWKPTIPFDEGIKEIIKVLK